MQVKYQLTEADIKEAIAAWLSKESVPVTPEDVTLAATCAYFSSPHQFTASVEIEDAPN